MAPRTLSSTWKQIEKLTFKIDEKKDRQVLPDLTELLSKVNNSKIVDALATLFVHPYSGMDEMNVSFISPEQHPEENPAYFDEDRKAFYVNPTNVLRFYKTCREASSNLGTPEARESFHNYRFQSYLAELSKLPSHFMLYITLLQEVAETCRICRIEKKSGESEIPEGANYLNLLWAFKELETFYKTTTGQNMRCEYNIHWHESEWIMGD